MRPQSATGSNTGVRSETGCPVILCPKHQACFKGSFRSSFLGRHQRGVASDKHTWHSRLGTCRPPADVNSAACRASNRITATTSFTAPNKCDEDRATTSTFLFGYDAQRRAEAERELRKLTDNGTDFGVRKGVDASTPENKESERVADKQEQRRDAEASVTQQLQEASSSLASQMDSEVGGSAAQISSKEALRRKRISAANRGKQPWNIGKKHSEETKRKIRERTKQAMQRPDVIHRLKTNFAPKPHTPESKAKISKSLQKFRLLQKQAVQELVNRETEKSLLAAIGELVDPPEVLNPRLAEGLEKTDPSTMDPEKLIGTATARKLTEHFSVERIHGILRAARKLRAKATEPESSDSDEEEGGVEAEPAQSSAVERDGSLSASSSGQEDVPGSEAIKQEVTRRLKAADHRAKIADSIRKKWEDPEYRARVTAGNARHSSSVQKPSRRRSRATTPKATTKATTSRARPKAERKTKPKTKTIVADVKLRKSERKPRPEEGLSHETMNKKLQVAARLAREMEAALEHFSEQELKEDNPEVQQSVWEAQELLRRAKAQVKKLSEGRLVALSKKDARLEDGRGQNGIGSDEVDKAMLVLNME